MLAPVSHADWDYAKAAHLLNRAGFGGTPEQIAELVELGPEKAVASFFDLPNLPPALPPWAAAGAQRLATFTQMKESPEGQRKELRRKVQQEQRQMLLDFRQWWLEQMLSGPAPLREKLVLFWHGHFATSAQKVKDSWFMMRQNAIFRQNAAGNWLTLLSAVSKDPAMLVWLDQAQSRKDHPNENFAREVMELFTLGEGHYTEKDVTEAARAFTGWTFDRATAQFVSRPRMHDSGEKTVLGKTGNLDGDDVLRVIVAQPRAAEFIVRKLWVFFAGDNPSDKLVHDLAVLFRARGNHFRPLLQTIFRSREFYADTIIRQQVKSPVQWLVGSMKLLGRKLPPPQVSAQILRSLGQELFLPPNVKGWDGGFAWVNSNSLLNRYNTAYFLVFGQQPISSNRPRMRGQLRAGRVKARDIIPEELKADKTKLLAHLEQRFIQGALKPAQQRTLREFLETAGELEEADLLHAIHLVMATPEYQLA